MDHAASQVHKRSHTALRNKGSLSPGKTKLHPSPAITHISEILLLDTRSGATFWNTSHTSQEMSILADLIIHASLKGIYRKDPFSAISVTIWWLTRIEQNWNILCKGLNKGLQAKTSRTCRKFIQSRQNEP